MDRKGLARTDFQPFQVLVEAWWIGFTADFNHHIVMMIGLFARGVWCSLDVDRDRIAVFDTAAFYRLVAGGAALQLRQRLFDGIVFQRHRRAAQRNRVQRTRIDRRQRFERRGEGERLPFVERNVLHVWRVHRLEAALAQRLVDRARDQVVRDVVENLLAESLLDEGGRNFALSESWDTRLPAVTAGDAIDFGVDDVARNFDGNAFLCFGEIGEFGFHFLILYRLHSVARATAGEAPNRRANGAKGGSRTP